MRNANNKRKTRQAIKCSTPRYFYEYIPIMVLMVVMAALYSYMIYEYRYIPKKHIQMISFLCHNYIAAKKVNMMIFYYKFDRFLPSRKHPSNMKTQYSRFFFTLYYYKILL